MQKTFIQKLDAIFEIDYTKIESKIISETNINGDNQTEEARFNFFIRDVLLDFIANFRYRMPRVLEHKISERTYIVNLSFMHFEMHFQILNMIGLRKMTL